MKAVWSVAAHTTVWHAWKQGVAGTKSHTGLSSWIFFLSVHEDEEGWQGMRV